MKRKNESPSQDENNAKRSCLANPHFEIGKSLYEQNKLWEALTLFNQILKMHPNEPDVLTLRGAVHLQMQNGELAFADLDKALSIQPNNIVALTKHGVACFQLGNIDQAMRDFNQVLAITPKNEYVLAARARCYIGKNQLEPALEDLNKVLALNSNNIAALCFRAMIYSKNNDEVASATYLSRALSLTPTNVEEASHQYNNQKDPQKALALLEDSLKKYPDSFKLQFCYAQSMFDSKNYQESLVAIKKALAIKPNHVNALFISINCYLNEKNYELALTDINKLITIDPNSISAWIIRSKIFMTLGKLDTALRDCEKALALDPKLIATLWLLVKIYSKQKEDEKVVAILNRIISIDNKNVNAYCKLAMHYHLKKEYTNSLMYLNAALVIKPDHKEALRDRGVLYICQKKYDLALMDANKVFALNPDDVFVMGLVGKAHYHLNQFDLALPYLNASLKEQWDPNLCINRADIHRKQNNFTHALMDYNALLAKEPNNESYLIARVALYLRDNKEMAIIELDKMIKKFPENLQMRSLRADALFDREFFEQAYEDYKTFYTKTPDANKTSQTGIVLKMAKALLKIGAEKVEQKVKNRNEAYKLYQQITNPARLNCPNDHFIEAAVGMGDIELDKKNYSSAHVSYSWAIIDSNNQCFEAFLGRIAINENNFMAMDPERYKLELLNDYTQVLAIKPHCAELLVKRATLYREKNRLAEALIDLNTALGLDTNLKSARVERVAVYLLQQQWELALNDCLHVLMRDPNHLTMLISSVEIYWLQKKFDLARQQLEKIFTLEPGNLRALRLSSSLYLDCKQFAQALPILNRILQIKPKNNIQVRLDRAKVYLFLAAEANKNENKKDEQNYLTLALRDFEADKVPSTFILEQKAGIQYRLNKAKQAILLEYEAYQSGRRENKVFSLQTLCKWSIFQNETAVNLCSFVFKPDAKQLINDREIRDILNELKGLATDLQINVAIPSMDKLIAAINKARETSDLDVDVDRLNAAITKIDQKLHALALGQVLKDSHITPETIAAMRKKLHTLPETFPNYFTQLAALDEQYKPSSSGNNTEVFS